MRVIAIICVSCLVPSLLLADSAVDVAALPQNEFMKVLTDRQAPISPAQAKQLLGVLPESIARNELEKAFENSASVSLLEILPHIVNKDGSQPALASLRKHEDVFLRFVANCGLTGSGDTDACETVHQLLHDETVSKLEKRLIKTWAIGAGIDPAKDDQDAILDHLMNLMGKNQKLNPGDSCPAFSATDRSGNELNSSTLKGTVTVLHFWSSSCRPCLAQMPKHIETLSQATTDGASVVFVSLDEDKERFEASVEKYAIPFHNVCDGSGWGGPLARTFGVKQLPFDIVIDADGKIFSHSIHKLPPETDSLGTKQ
ncbi:Thiol-disulfide oxidoreductase ResA [Stieleria neptunia]|uniref:Thiol-disulfide oxidoreductase ResA n=1 Tax=Stieleria neptunia TaxID=2527979 RepID=A0A518HHT5_9BACT|nr:TlpA disulfide reductase family protein [Stieleria neptunia]QDV40390.1 Thiol-disulfide oxidoreductase ResA [Stieleria neptunia]